MTVEEDELFASQEKYKQDQQELTDMRKSSTTKLVLPFFVLACGVSACLYDGSMEVK